jgi:hypothetical protein
MRHNDLRKPQGFNDNKPSNMLLKALKKLAFNYSIEI